MNAVQAKIAKTDTEMLMITALTINDNGAATPEERMVRALINDELVKRHPHTADAVEAWSNDYETELTMFDVILAAM